jgi:hypothetical protein
MPPPPSAPTMLVWRMGAERLSEIHCPVPNHSHNSPHSRTRRSLRSLLLHSILRFPPHHSRRHWRGSSGWGSPVPSPCLARRCGAWRGRPRGVRISRSRWYSDLRVRESSRPGRRVAGLFLRDVGFLWRLLLFRLASMLARAIQGAISGSCGRCVRENAGAEPENQVNQGSHPGARVLARV